jgi:hypothetical protein
MAFEHGLHQRNPFLSRDIGQADETGVAGALHKDKLTEVLVHGDEHSLFVVRPSQQYPITRIGATIPGLYDIMTLLAEPGRKPRTGAPINEKLHG